MGWDYSNLSHLAKQNGGPAALLAKHAAYHFKKGAVSKNPIITVASLVSLGIGIGGATLYFKWKNKKDKIIVTDCEIQKIEDELIAGMKHAEEVETMHEVNQEKASQFQPPKDDNGNEDFGVSN